MLLPELELHVQPSRTSTRQDVARLELHLGESLAALDPVEAEAGNEVEVLVEPALRDRHLEWAAPGRGRNSRTLRGCELPPRRPLVSHHPARHRDLEDRDQVGALPEMRLERRRVV